MADEKKELPKKEHPDSEKSKPDEPEVLDDGEEEEEKTVKGCCSTSTNLIR